MLLCLALWARCRLRAASLSLSPSLALTPPPPPPPLIVDALGTVLLPLPVALSALQQEGWGTLITLGTKWCFCWRWRLQFKWFKCVVCGLRGLYIVKVPFTEIDCPVALWKLHRSPHFICKALWWPLGELFDLIPTEHERPCGSCCTQDVVNCNLSTVLPVTVWKQARLHAARLICSRRLHLLLLQRCSHLSNFTLKKKGGLCLDQSF